MADVIQSILYFLQGTVSFIINIVNGLYQLILMIPKALGFVSISLGALPPVLTVFAVAFVSVSIVYLIIGR